MVDRISSGPCTTIHELATQVDNAITEVTNNVTEITNNVTELTEIVNNIVDGGSGVPGETPIVTVGTTITLPPGSPATVDGTQNVPPDPAGVVLDFGIPGGLPGGGAGSDGIDGDAFFGTTTVQFRLTASFALSETQATGVLLLADGSDSTTTYTFLDLQQKFNGAGPYLGYDGSLQPGFTGTASTTSNANGDYKIVDQEQLFPLILVEMVDTVTLNGNTPFGANFKRGFGNKYRIPPQGTAGQVDVYNDDLIVGTTLSGIWVYAAWDAEVERYEIVRDMTGSGGSGGDTFQTIAFAVTDKEIPAASVVDDTQVVAGSVTDVPIFGGGTGGTFVPLTDPLTELPLLGTIYNLYKTAIGKESAAIIATPVVRVPGSLSEWVVINGKDFRGGPYYDETLNQHWMHQADSEAFELVEVCTEYVVNDVFVGSDKLQFQRHPWDDCTTEVVDIIDIGECSEPIAPIQTGDDTWGNSGLPYN